MDIHDLKIFLMIAQACSVSGNTYRNGCKRYAQERLHDKKKVDKWLNGDEERERVRAE